MVLLTRAVELRSLPSKLLASSQAPYHVSVVGGNSPQSTSTCLFRWLGTALPDVNKTKLQIIGKAACAATGFQFCHERPSLPGKHVLNFSTGITALQQHSDQSSSLSKFVPPATHYDLWPLVHAPLCHLRATATTSSQKTLTNMRFINSTNCLTPAKPQERYQNKPLLLASR